jgi:hypothetical protein
MSNGAEQRRSGVLRAALARMRTACALCVMGRRLAFAVVLVCAGLAIAQPVLKPAAQSPAPSATAPDKVALQPLFAIVGLTVGHEGEQYPPTNLLSGGGRPPFSYKVLQGKLPAGLKVTAMADLVGTPTEAGEFPFTLEIGDGESPPQFLRQAYVLRIDAARALPRASSAAEPTAPETRGAPENTADMTPVDEIDTYMLKAADIVSLTAGVDTDKKENSAQVNHLQAVLAPLTDVEYPSRAMFEAALLGRQCLYYFQLINAGLPKAAAGTPTCPPKPEKALTGRTAARAKGVVYDTLLPKDEFDRAIVLAHRTHALSDSATLQWRSQAKCGCVPSLVKAERGDLVYGFFTFWLSPPPPAAATSAPVSAAPPPVIPRIDFGSFHRIGVLGLQFNDSLDFIPSPAWLQTIRDAASLAHRYGTEMDLVLQRDSWAMLQSLNADELKSLAGTAAQNAVALADTALTGGTIFLPAGAGADHVFDGITVQFDDSGAAKGGNFPYFFDQFIDAVIAAMQKTGRTLALNIVIPDDLLGERDGPYNWTRLMDIIHHAEMPDNPLIPQGTENVAHVFRGTTPITVHYLVLLKEPTTLSKKQLRQTIDEEEQYKGHERVMLLTSVIPVIFHAAGTKPDPMDQSDQDQLSDDLAYYQWNYGGVAFWPLPVPDAGTGSIVSVLLSRTYFSGNESNLTKLCPYVCPYRATLHPLWVMLAAVTVVGFVVYLWFCRVRRWHRSVLIAIWCPLVLFLALSVALINCDPQLAKVRQSNWIIALPLAILLIPAAWFSFKPEVKDP